MLLMAMVAIVLAGTLAIALVQAALAQRKQAEVDRRQMQAEWYAEAGVDRALAELEADADYAGETWTLAETRNGRERTAEIVIQIDRETQPPRLVVVADYPVGELRRSRSRRELSLVSPPGATAVSALLPENRLP
jgi:type II secretory pathway pseudopilin PulG